MSKKNENNEIDKNISIALRTRDNNALAEWLVETLGFTIIETSVSCEFKIVKNGSCKILIFSENCNQLDTIDNNEYYYGFVHVAIKTTNIDSAIEHCIKKGLDLELNNGKAFYNPKVFGDGEYYFNIRSPFGIIFEISCRASDVNKNQTQTSLFTGLDHIGIAAADFDKELDFFESLGFKREFEPVVNTGSDDGKVICVMVSLLNATLEIYQFVDKNPVSQPLMSHYKGIVYSVKSVQSPSGVNVFNTGKE